MLSRLIEMIKDALRSMVAYKSITDVVNTDGIESVTDDMSHAFEMWREIYKNNPAWLNSSEGVESQGLAKLACEVASFLILNELDLKVIPEGYDVESGADIDPDSRAGYINKLIKDHLLPRIDEELEHALAMGGFIIKPYVSGGKLYFDFVSQGDFYPISFDDDGNIADVAFVDRFIAGDTQYTRVERHTFANKQVVVENKAFKAKYMRGDKNLQELGNEIPLDMVDKWASMEPVTTISNVERPLYGYFKVAKKNNIDTRSSLGVSLFSNAIGKLEKIDRQSARLDWEYEGGEMAIDVDTTALTVAKHKATKGVIPYDSYPHSKERLLRAIDLGQDNTYNQFNPNLRDVSYLLGLNDYKKDAEDLMCLPRGSLGAKQEISLKTATEVIVQEKRAYDFIAKNQRKLNSCLEDVIYAISAYLELYKKELGVPQGVYQTAITFGDSILLDREAQLASMLNLCDHNIVSKAEVRKFYTGEPLNVASKQVQAIIDGNKANMLNDMLGSLPGSDEDEDEDSTDGENGADK